MTYGRNLNGSALKHRIFGSMESFELQFTFCKRPENSSQDLDPSAPGPKYLSLQEFHLALASPLNLEKHRA
jgi:hypothetical protein